MSIKNIHNFTVEQTGTESCYKISGNGAPNDFEIRIRMEQGRFKAEANYKRKPSHGATSEWQPRIMSFATEEQALESALFFFASSKEPYEKDE